MLSVPKRLRYFMQRDGAVLSMVLRIFLRVIAQSLQDHCAGTAQVDRAALHIGAVAFIHRFGSNLNEHVHLHVCVVDGVFEEVAGDVVTGADTDAQAVTDGQSSPSKVIFQPASAIDEIAVAQVQAATAGCDVPTQPKPTPPRRSQAHYLWAVLIARIYKVFPLLCPLCGGQMRIIAFITHSADIRQILDHIGV